MAAATNHHCSPWGTAAKLKAVLPRGTFVRTEIRVLNVKTSINLTTTPSEYAKIIGNNHFNIEMIRASDDGSSHETFAILHKLQHKLPKKWGPGHMYLSFTKGGEKTPVIIPFEGEMFKKKIGKTNFWAICCRLKDLSAELPPGSPYVPQFPGRSAPAVPRPLALYTSRKAPAPYNPTPLALLAKQIPKTRPPLLRQDSPERQPSNSSNNYFASPPRFDHIRFEIQGFFDVSFQEMSPMHKTPPPKIIEILEADTSVSPRRSLPEILGSSTPQPGRAFPRSPLPISPLTRPQDDRRRDEADKIPIHSKKLKF